MQVGNSASQSVPSTSHLRGPTMLSPQPYVDELARAQKHFVLVPVVRIALDVFWTDLNGGNASSQTVSKEQWLPWASNFCAHHNPIDRTLEDVWLGLSADGATCTRGVWEAETMASAVAMCIDNLSAEAISAALSTIYAESHPPADPQHNSGCDAPSGPQSQPLILPLQVC